MSFSKACTPNTTTKMEYNLSLEGDIMSSLALQTIEGTGINVRGLRFGLEGGQGFYPVTEPLATEKPAGAVQFYSLLNLAHVLFISGTVANLLAPQFFARPWDQPK